METSEGNGGTARRSTRTRTSATGGASPAPSAKSTNSGGSKSSSRSATPVHGSAAPAAAVEESPAPTAEMTLEGTAGGRGSRQSSRLNNPELAAKHKAFMAKVTAATKGSMDTYLTNEIISETMPGPGNKRKPVTPKPEEQGSAKRRRSARTNSSGAESQNSTSNNDCYCWICHKEGEFICCETCPRVFHARCLQLDSSPPEDWVCPECVLVMSAENMDTRSRAMRLLTIDQLCTLLKHALTRMKSVANVEPFLKPVDPLQFPAYKDYVSFPMDLASMERNIRKKQYGSTEAMLADCKWILHNCIIFNSTSSKLTSIAKSIVNVCKHEMQEVENCPDCYLNAHVKKDVWFTEACRLPHPLVWAKLKGFPYWPGKLMRINSKDNHGDVRFFGAHDRAWIPMKDIYLYSEKPPTDIKKKRGNIEPSFEEVEKHRKRLAERFGQVEYAEPKTAYDPARELDMLKILLPNFTPPFDIGKLGRRSRSFSCSGSERSRDATPTPSDFGTEDGEEEEEGEGEGEDLEDSKSITSQEGLDVPAATTENHPEEKITITLPKHVITSEDTKISINDEPIPTPTPKLMPIKVKINTKLATVEASHIITPSDLGNTSVMQSRKEPKVDIIKVKAIFKDEHGNLEVVSNETIINEQKQSGDDVSEEKVEEKSDLKENDQEMEDLTSQDPDEKISTEKSTEEEAEPEENSSVKASDEEKADLSDNYEETSIAAEQTADLSAVENPAVSIADKDPSEPIAVAEPAVSISVKKPSVLTAVEEQPTGEDTSIATSVNEKTTDIESTKDIINDTSNTTTNDTVHDNVTSTARVTVSPPCEVTSTTLNPTPSADMLLEDGEAVAKTCGGASETEGYLADSNNEKIIIEGDDDMDEDLEMNVEEEPATQPAIPLKPKESKTEKSPEKGKDNEATSDDKDDSKDTTIENSEQPKKKTPLDYLGACASLTVTKKISPEKKKESDTKTTDQSVNKRPTSGEETESQSREKKRKLSSENVLESESELTISKVKRISTKEFESSAARSTTSPQQQSSASGRRQSQSPKASASPSPVGHPPPPYLPRFPGMRPPGMHPMGHMGMPMLGPNGMMVRGPPPHFRGPPGLAGGNRPPHPAQPAGPLNLPPNLPSTAGPVAEQLNTVAKRLADTLKGHFLESLSSVTEELEEGSSPAAAVKKMKAEIERAEWRHQQELAEMKHNADLVITEMRQAMEAEKQKALHDCKKQAEIEKVNAIKEMKKKQWCAHCGKEAIFYCCWNTSYCDYPCQQAHWPSHMTTCAQNGAKQSAAAAEEESAADQLTTIQQQYLQQHHHQQQMAAAAAASRAAAAARHSMMMGGAAGMRFMRPPGRMGGHPMQGYPRPYFM